jgi:hypothetical protein
MKILTKVWKKLLNEAGIPVFHTINEQTESLIPMWDEGHTLQIRQYIRFPSKISGAVSFRIE